MTRSEARLVRPRRRPRRGSLRSWAWLPLVVASLAACGRDDQAQTAAGGLSGSGSSTTELSSGEGDHSGTGAHGDLDRADRVSAQLATAAFQDVGEAEAAGYASTLDSLGCFQDRQRGGMGVHYVNDALMDGAVDIAHPEALVYELDARGAIVGLVAHEYIVPTSAWSQPTPPKLSGIALHRHPTLPLWVLHMWLWKDNPAGMLDDWNPAVRLCPAGVPIFGVDRPKPSAPAAESGPAAAPADGGHRGGTRAF